MKRLESARSIYCTIRLLVSNGIEYSLNADGYYFSDLENLDTMDELALQAHDQLRSVSQIQVDKGCVIDKLKEALQGAIYITGEDEKGMYLRAATSTYKRYDVVSKVATAERECAEGA